MGYSTQQYGSFDGNSWEDFCQICFKLKYGFDDYQHIPAWQGDMGIEGISWKTLDVFQCYCPDRQYTENELYDKYRNKITTDLKKLENNKDLKSYLKGKKIKRWIFVVPEYRKKDIVMHCSAKSKEYREKKIDILDSEFIVLVHDISFYTDVAEIALNGISKKLKIDLPATLDIKEHITNWKSAASSTKHIKTAFDKNDRLIPEARKDGSNQIVNNLTDQTIRHFLEGDVILKNWEQSFQEQFERFKEVVDIIEDEVERKSWTSNLNHYDLFEEIKNDLRNRLSTEFKHLDSTMIDKLTNKVIADWIMYCPLNFI